MLGVVSLRSMSALGQLVAFEVQFGVPRGPRLAHLEPLGATFGLLPPLFGALSEPTRANLGAILGPSSGHFAATWCIRPLGLAPRCCIAAASLVCHFFQSNLEKY